nr:formate dehydrogenase accessory sulfurtransferase FdhD [Thalassovita taeanensis]
MALPDLHPVGSRARARALPEEVPVALVYNGSTLAVMMASPVDLEEFALGFSLTEGIVTAPGQLGEVEVVTHPKGIELRMWLQADRAGVLEQRRRALAGPVGCGLCGIDSLDQALRTLPPVSGGAMRLTSADIVAAVEGLRDCQPLHDATHAVHAAGFYLPGTGMMCAREDVGRHNALDKLAGALAQGGIAPGTGAVVLTSRVSADMVQKAAAIGAPCVIAVSAPTTMGVQVAEETGLTLIARARGGTYEVFAHAHRIDTGGPQ